MKRFAAAIMSGESACRDKARRLCLDMPSGCCPAACLQVEAAAGCLAGAAFFCTFVDLLAWTNAATSCDALRMSARATAASRVVTHVTLPGHVLSVALSADAPRWTSFSPPRLFFFRPFTLSLALDSTTYGETQSTSVPASCEETYMRHRRASLRSRSTLPPPPSFPGPASFCRLPINHESSLVRDPIASQCACMLKCACRHM